MISSTAGNDLTRISQFDGWCAKREDEAGYVDAGYPSGSKVRQYAAMAARSPGAAMIVGCSANSAMQIYVAAAAKRAGVPGIIYTARRGERTAATQYAVALGAQVIEWGSGAYLSVLRSKAREHAVGLPSYVMWDPGAALRDAADQCRNLPGWARRVLVPTGSGLTCAGVLAGLAEQGSGATVVAVAVSGMATYEEIIRQAVKVTRRVLPPFELIRVPVPYDKWATRRLPDLTPLDPFYAAKALAYVQPGDCLWIPGLRPLAAMPVACRDAYQDIAAASV
jgi:1-aminocyclopropane-1-carboxylate deaminase/D-cysteine desulfhydrase-like pyridoxal-dependent ACC family enzyme